MKVLAILIVAVSSASAGSGPYLPSGWRPEGPAFFLPGEVIAKPSENPLKDTLFQESEASGSDFLREYGPPKEVSQDITQQGLPGVVTEQAFLVIQAKFNQDVISEEIKETGKDVAVEEAVTPTEEAITEQSSTVAEELVTVTEAQIVDDITTEPTKEEKLVQGRALKLEIEANIAETTDGFVEAAIVTDKQEIEADKVVEQSDANKERTIQDPVNSEAKAVEQNEQVQQEIQRNVNSEVKKVDENLKEAVEQTVKILEEVKSIAQEVVKVETEIAQDQNVEGSGGMKSVQIAGSLAQVPEGFLEYGPPGFREYGPPKGDELLRSTAVQETSEAELIENNETRRRRFSPKFRSGRKH